MRHVIFFIIVILLLVVFLCPSPRTPIFSTEIFVRNGVGPFAHVTSGGKSKIPALLDTGSIYFLTTGNSKEACQIGDLSSQPQEYHYAGPSAQFKWISSHTFLNTIDLGCIPIGAVPSSSAQALGLPAVLGLAALPVWASQRFGIKSLVNFMNVEEFWFILNEDEKLFVIGGSGKDKSGKRIAKVSMNPSIFSPTPGLGYLTIDITKLEVFFTSNVNYTIRRVKAADSLPQTSQFHYTISDNNVEYQGVLQATEWMCLFDTGTFPAVFYADASVNLLGPRVSQSMIAGQTAQSDFTVASSVIYTWNNNESIKVDNVIVPKLLPHNLIHAKSLMTVCGFQFQMNYNIRYKINQDTGLPVSVSFYDRLIRDKLEDKLEDINGTNTIRTFGGQYLTE